MTTTTTPDAPLRRVTTIAELVEGLGGSLAIQHRLMAREGEPEMWIARGWIQPGWHLRLYLFAKQMGLQVDLSVFDLNDSWLPR